MMGSSQGGCGSPSTETLKLRLGCGSDHLIELWVLLFIAVQLDQRIF